MKKFSRKIFFVLSFILIFGLHISSGFCTTINDIISDSTSTEDQNNINTDSDNISIHDDSTQTSYFAIQLGVYLKQKDADNQIIDFKTKGFDPYIFQSINSKGQTVYSARIGKYENYQTAGNELSRLEKNFNQTALITYYDSLNPVDSTEILSSSRKPPAEVAPESSDDQPSDAVQENLETDPYASVNESESLKALQEKINALESAIEQLQEESDVRRQLTITEEESAQEEEDILEAAGRQYTLTEAGNIKFRVGVSYAYSEYDAIKEAARVEDVADHTISTSLNVSYGLKDNVTLGVGIPFVYKYHKVGTVDSMDTNDLGDLGLSWQFQPSKSSGDLPTIIINGSFSVPVGRSPYEIQVGEELSTSSGLYSTNLGVSVSQVSDPVVVYSSFGLTYSLPLSGINQKRAEGVLDKIDPGIGLGVGAGMGYALSYKLNLNLSFNYSYSFETTYKYKNAPEATSGVGVSAGLTLGVGYKVSQNQNLNFYLGIPLTNSRSFSFGFSTPIEFEL
ncbi:MAG: hypothetical protein HF978_12730 [Desulfobacteraceae bacterium]|nr:SPOR domain-containing protein [Desulfobacteraceae bacterium]MBC2756404.1 hypothetical protein [Desulfobacteraceae bacterium]MBC2763534.1 hypothetical protein [ANME-2 cluster archaeon]